jgi:hypothetical protein
MKNFKFIIQIVLLSFLIFHCSGETEETKELKRPQDEISQLDSTELHTNNNQTDLNDVSFHLAYKFKQGATFKYKLTTLSSTERDIQSDSVVIDRFEQKIERILNFTILSVEKDSIAEIECNISKVYVDVDLNNQKISYQSGVTSDPTELKKYIEHEGLVNNPFHIRITKYGEVLEIYKVEGISNRYLDLSGLKDSVSVEDKSIMEDEVKNSLLKPLIGQVLRELPIQQLRLKSTWENTVDPASIMIFKIHYTDHFMVDDIELAGEDRIARINSNAISLIEGEKEYTNNDIKYEFAEPLTEATGEFDFNIDKGLVHNSETRTILKLSYRMEIPSAEGTKIGKSNEFITNTNTLELL